MIRYPPLPTITHCYQPFPHRSLRSHIAQLQECFEEGRATQRRAGGRKGDGAAAEGLSTTQWETCVTTACNWLECVIGTGIYAQQLLSWLRYFRKEQFLVLEATQLHVDHAETAAKIRAFLSLPAQASAEPFGGRDGNSSGVVIGDQAKRLMQRFYSDHNKQLKGLLEGVAPNGGWMQAAWLS